MRGQDTRFLRYSQLRTGAQVLRCATSRQVNRGRKGGREGGSVSSQVFEEISLLVLIQRQQLLLLLLLLFVWRCIVWCVEFGQVHGVCRVEVTVRETCAGRSVCEGVLNVNGWLE